uniref:Metallothionein-like protein n=1 Tax=Betula platyphylla TaxID=78630 RepID=Q508T1_BETPL|nr:metallothionein-like protein [Betula platyphylla]
MSSCGGNCNCGSDCKCGSGCKCGKHADLSYSEKTTTETIIAGVAPVKINYEGSEMSSGAENGCKCGSNCSCDPCSCK